MTGKCSGLVGLAIGVHFVCIPQGGSHHPTLSPTHQIMGCAESDFDFDLNDISVISTAQQIDSTMPKNELFTHLANSVAGLLRYTCGRGHAYICIRVIRFGKKNACRVPPIW